MTFRLDQEIKNALPNSISFADIMQLRGKIYRKIESRCTQRIFLNTTPYFIKQHFGVGWKEIFKNLLLGRLPILSAHNELAAIERLQKSGIATAEVVGYGCKGINPAKRQSFLITHELPPFITLEDLTLNWGTSRPPFSFKIQLIQQVAIIARTLHQQGMNHRDFYICHFLLDLLEYTKQSVKLYLIDLHRAQIRRRTPIRWIVKDIAGLYFSSKEIGLTQRDLFRFMKFYRDKPLREIINKETTFWWKVKKRGDKLYRRHQNRSA